MPGAPVSRSELRSELRSFERRLNKRFDALEGRLDAMQKETDGRFLHVTEALTTILACVMVIDSKVQGETLPDTLERLNAALEQRRREAAQ